MRVFNVLTPWLFTSFASALNRLISIQPMQMRPGERRLRNICGSSFRCQGKWALGGGRGGGGVQGRGGSSHRNGNSPISEVTRSAKEKGEPRRRWQGHQFHETFPPLHLKAWHNHAEGRCTMKWNGRPDPGERTQCRVHRNEGHSLPGDASVSGKDPASPGQARQGSSWYRSVSELYVLDAGDAEGIKCVYIRYLARTL